MSRLKRSSVVKGTIAIAAVVLIGLLLVGTLGALFNGSDRTDAGAPIKTGINPGSPTQITSPFRINSDAELTAKVVEAAHALGATVEAEIGHLPDASTLGSAQPDLGMRTNPDEARRLCDEAADVLRRLK